MSISIVQLHFTEFGIFCLVPSNLKDIIVITLLSVRYVAYLHLRKRGLTIFRCFYSNKLLAFDTLGMFFIYNNLRSKFYGGLF